LKQQQAIQYDQLAGFATSNFGDTPARVTRYENSKEQHNVTGATQHSMSHHMLHSLTLNHSAISRCADCTAQAEQRSSFFLKKRAAPSMQSKQAASPDPCMQGCSFLCVSSAVLAVCSFICKQSLCTAQHVECYRHQQQSCCSKQAALFNSNLVSSRDGNAARTADHSLTQYVLLLIIHHIQTSTESDPWMMLRPTSTPKSPLQQHNPNNIQMPE
jgi:hypothetical protein